MEFREPVRARPLVAHAEGADRAVAQDSVVDIDLNDEWRIVVCERRAGSNWMVCTYISERVVSDHASENVAELLDDLRPLKAVADDGLHPNGRHHREDRAVDIVQDVAALSATTWLALLEECNLDASNIVAYRLNEGAVAWPEPLVCLGLQSQRPRARLPPRDHGRETGTGPAKHLES